VAREFDVTLVIREEKGAYYSSAVAEHPMVAEHFDRLAKSEEAYFGKARWPGVTTIDCPRSAVNEPQKARLAVEARSDVIFLFGTTILGDEWLAPFAGRIINVHLGLSPFYRGSATLFWPVAKGELECVGATIHLAERKVDAGPILARVKPQLEVGDTYYDIGNKTIRSAVDALPNVARRFLAGKISPVVQDLSGGALYRKRDFNPSALRAALDFVGAGLTPGHIDHLARSTRCAC
jgi:folate-dependent phosphoribosylglycinamide formyltransferase PurN